MVLYNQEFSKCFSTAWKNQMQSAGGTSWKNLGTNERTSPDEPLFISCSVLRAHERPFNL
jgi:hypothetical protein